VRNFAVDHRTPSTPASRSNGDEGSTDAVRLLRPVEVVELLGVSRSWLYLAAAQNRIPHIRLGGPDGPLRFQRDDVMAWLGACRSTWRPGDSLRATSLRAAQLRDDAPAA
jgi:excisionase family DNA binding protein